MWLHDVQNNTLHTGLHCATRQNVPIAFLLWFILLVVLMLNIMVPLSHLFNFLF